jgi:hypothetical protein
MMSAVISTIIAIKAAATKGSHTSIHSCAKRSSPGRLICTDPVKFPSPGLLIWLSLCGRMHLSCGLVKVREIRESEVCAEGEGYSKVEGSAKENPGLSK